MSGVTRKIEDSVKALEEGKIKKALLLTDTVKTETEHAVVVDAAKKCVEDKEKCMAYCKEAAGVLKDRITPTGEDTSLEGVEEMLAEGNKPEKPAAEKTDEELYEDCEECHVANAVVKFSEISEKCADGVHEEIDHISEDPNTPPEKWLRTMVEITENATCSQDAYKAVLTDLTEYLEKRKSPILNKLDEEQHA